MQRISITNPQNIIDGTAKKYYFKLRNTGGPKGDKGDKGDTGSRGPQGEPGNAATVYVGSTTTLPVGQDATVENVGTQYNAVLNFGIPQGPRGPQGVKGDPGEPGQKGEPGPRGIQGERGTNATVYVGTTSTLNPGSQATVYNSGTDSNAVLNFGIPKGEKGDTGPMPTIAQATGQAIDQVMSQKATTDALNTKQNALTAGQGIDITSDVISTPALVPEVVAELPTTGEEGKLYLTPKAHTTQTATGNPITASVTEQAGAIESFQLDGDTTQQTYSGVQVVKKQGFATPASDTDFWTISNATQSDISSDGFSTFTFSGTGFKNFFIKQAGSDIKASTTYTVIIELDKVSDVPFMSVTQGNTGSDSFPDFTPISLPDGAHMTSSGNATHGSVTMTAGNGGNIVLLGTTASTLKTQTLRFFTSSASSDGKKIRARVSIIEGDHSSDWQNYSGDNWQPYVGGTASPNPDYPQAVNTVTGRQMVEVTGKNLFNLNGDQQPNARCTGTINGQSITITSTANSTGYYAIVIPNSSELLGKTATISVGDVTVSSDVETTGRILIYQAVSTQPNSVGNNIGAVDIKSKGPASATFTFPSSFQRGKDCFAVVLYVNARALSTVVGEYSTYTNIQLELGSTGTDYEPYSSNGYEINLGKNLFDVQDATGTRGSNTVVASSQTITLNSNTGGTETAFYLNDVSQISQYLAKSYSSARDYKITGLGGSYTLCITLANIPSGVGSLVWDVYTNKRTLQYSRSDIADGKITKTITLSSDEYIKSVQFYTSATSVFSDFTMTVQIELGSQATSYAAYFEPIELCKIGDYQDYIYKDDGEWKIHKETGKVDLSSITWETYANTLKRSGINPIADMLYVESNQQVGVGLTDGFQIRKGSGLSAVSLLGYFAIDTNRLAFNVGSDGNDPSGSLYYALATPTDTTITDQTLIAQLEAIRNATLQSSNTITNTAAGSNLAGDMEIGYYGYNPTNRYDKFIWLDLNNAYEQLNNPDTSSTLSTRSLGTTAEQPTVTRSLETETITLKKGEAEPIEDKTGLPTIQDEETEEAETTEPEESDGTDER